MCFEFFRSNEFEANCIELSDNLQHRKKVEKLGNYRDLHNTYKNLIIHEMLKKD